MSDVITRLEATIQERKQSSLENSYTASLFKEGTARIAQKVGGGRCRGSYRLTGRR